MGVVSNQPFYSWLYISPAKKGERQLALKILTISSTVNAHWGITQRKRGEAHLKKWCIFFLILYLQGQQWVLVLMCLAASYLHFLPNFWSSSGVSVSTQDDEIEQISFLWDFWCLFADSGGLGPSAPLASPCSFCSGNDLGGPKHWVLQS